MLLQNLVITYQKNASCTILDSFLSTYWAQLKSIWPTYTVCCGFTLQALIDSILSITEPRLSIAGSQ